MVSAIPIVPGRAPFLLRAQVLPFAPAHAEALGSDMLVCPDLHLFSRLCISASDRQGLGQEKIFREGVRV